MAIEDLCFFGGGSIIVPKPLSNHLSFGCFGMHIDNIENEADRRLSALPAWQSTTDG